MNFQEKTADLLYKAVKKSSVSPAVLEPGDFIVVTKEFGDVVGIINSLEKQGKYTNLILKTSSGLQTVQVDDTNFIHIVQKVGLLNLRDHHQYERTNEESNKEVDMTKKNNEHYERPQFTIENSNKSELPTSKISLSLHREVKG